MGDQARSQYASVDTGTTFETFINSDDLSTLLDSFMVICAKYNLQPGEYSKFFPEFVTHVERYVSPKHKELFTMLSERGQMKEYCDNSVAQGLKVLLIGGGPCGLRAAIECQLLGAETTLIERRTDFTRNNVVRLWSFVMDDLKLLGGKKIFLSLGNGSVNHIGIRDVQFTLMKICLMLGVEVMVDTVFKELIPPTKENESWKAKIEMYGKEIQEDFDVIIGASGKHIDLPGFERKSCEKKMAIAITANFVNNRTTIESQVKEIPGLSKQYDLEFFKALKDENGIDLENVVYFQGNTHYFVMTATKQSLMKKGVIISDKDDRKELLKQENILQQGLENYATEVALFSTQYFSNALPHVKFAKIAKTHRNDISIFDFTNLYASTNASRIIRRKNRKLLLALVGDSLIEPFWPQGTGMGKGFLSVFDTIWMIKGFAEGKDPLEIIREREKLFLLLKQANESAVRRDTKKFTINPSTRYVNTIMPFNEDRVLSFYETD